MMKNTNIGLPVQFAQFLIPSSLACFSEQRTSVHMHPHDPEIAIISHLGVHFSRPREVPIPITDDLAACDKLPHDPFPRLKGPEHMHFSGRLALARSTSYPIPQEKRLCSHIALAQRHSFDEDYDNATR
ncbi:hypothetical protein CDV36_005651 [Fusarium kuroshium]|uniref:Uncharacterized protein n=1 Tax=Fusarium kuroshium TaxID=2010991 RepID=A0A3M2SAW5_9HYPO|nr:hypothetical protein CDV36_005651 [Fusarium kuroshium]